MATDSNILVWRITWTEELGRLQSAGSQRVGHDWSLYIHTHTHTHTHTRTHPTTSEATSLGCTHFLKSVESSILYLFLPVFALHPNHPTWKPQF